MTLPTLNRTSLVLAVLGMFIAGTLSLGHFLNVVVPCGMNSGCDKVTTSSLAYWGGIPVAYFGFSAYLVLAGIAFLRMTKPSDDPRVMVQLGTAISSVGTLISGWFMYGSLVVIKGICPWCIASALTMLAILIVHVLMLRHPEETPTKDDSRANFGLAMGLPLAFLVGIGAQAAILNKQPQLVANLDRAVKEDNVALVLKEPLNSKGPKDADITVVEFLDFFCPACRGSYPTIMGLSEKMPNVRFAYRHYPLYTKAGHENALLAAILSEYAAEKGKFWDYIALLMEGKPEDYPTPDSIFALIQKLGLDPEEARKRVPVEDDPIFSRVYADMELANKIGINMTPTFYVVAKGLPAKIVNVAELEPLLATPPYQALINKPVGSGPLAPEANGP